MVSEFIKIKRDAAVTICFGLPAFIKNKIGLKKIPPPIPTVPETNPKTPPIKIEKNMGIFIKLNSLSSYDLKLIRSRNPAVPKTRNNKISNSSFSTIKVPPKKDIGIDPNKYGIRSLTFKFPVLM